MDGEEAHAERRFAFTPWILILALVTQVPIEMKDE
jgi:hypothetical protein